MKYYRGVDTECYINTGELRVIGVEDFGVFYVNSSTSFLFLLNSLRKVKYNLFACYNLDYDIGAIIKLCFPIEKYRQIYLGIRTNHKGIGIKYIAKKKAILYYKSYRFYFYDCYQFYKTSLTVASKGYLKKEKIDFHIYNLLEGILERKIIDVLHYCYNDSILCGELFRLVYDKIREKLNLNEPELLSQGYISYLYFKNELATVPKPYEFLFEQSYLGGRFEVFKRGYFKKAYAYDISSAYPKAITEIKDITQCDTVINNRYLERSDYSIFLCNIILDRDLIISPLGIKVNNKVFYPVGIFKDVFIDKNTYQTIMRYSGRSKIDIKMASHLICKKGYLFRDKINKLYKLKKKFPEDSEIYKIASNSLYGKLLQKVPNYIKKQGSKFSFSINDSYYDRQNNELFFKFDKKHRIRNAIYASFITSYTRSQIYKDIYKYHNNIIAIFTDCIISDIPLPLPLTDKLGDYKLKIMRDLYMIGTGIYFYKIEGEDKLLFRGFNVSNPQDIINKILNSKISKVRFKMKQRVSLGKALSMHNEKNYNLIYNMEKVLDLNFDVKRLWAKRIKKGKDLKGVIPSKPLPMI